ncbi:MAG: WhiB family transcriptional regulator [Acidimicrobiales bacterium]
MAVRHDLEDWQERAACRGPQASAFFPPSVGERKEDRSRRESLAKSICHACRVSSDCLEYAIKIREQHGIWGGLNETERMVLLEKRHSAR